MSAILYPMATPFVAYYALKYATGFAVDTIVDKTKKALWYVVTYPFKKTENECIKCKCEKCNNENCVDVDCYQEYEIVGPKEKID